MSTNDSNLDADCRIKVFRWTLESTSESNFTSDEKPEVIQKFDSDFDSGINLKTKNLTPALTLQQSQVWSMTPNRTFDSEITVKIWLTKQILKLDLDFTSLPKPIMKLDSNSALAPEPQLYFDSYSDLWLLNQN